MEKDHKMLSEAVQSKAFDRQQSAAMAAGATNCIHQRLEETDARARGILAAAAVPDACGPEIPLAPARGPLKTFRPIELVPGTVGVARDTGHWQRGEDSRRRGARIMDVFDRMTGPNALTPAQVQIGRDYRDLAERHEAGGMKCASLEAAGRGSGGQGGEFIDVFVAEGRRLEEMRDRIGAGVAMSVRRIRPSKRGAAAKGLITDRDLVDRVCRGDLDLGQVLDAFGWSAYGASRAALRKALAAALDRMQGYDLHPTPK